MRHAPGLRPGDIRCWISPRDLMVGQNFGDAIPKAIRASRAVVLVFTENTNRSKWVGKELERAVHHGLPIFPLKVQNVDPSDEIDLYSAGQHWLNAITPPLEQHLERLANSLVRLLGLPEIPRQEPGPAGGDTATVQKDRKRRTARRWAIFLAAPLLLALIGIIVTVAALHPTRLPSDTAAFKPPINGGDIDRMAARVLTIASDCTRDPSLLGRGGWNCGNWP